MSYNEADAAYDAYAQEQYYNELREEIARDLKDSAILRIRDTILDISGSYRALVQDSVQSSRVLRRLNPPDHLGAFFHSFRAIDAYLDAVVIRPMLEVVLEPIADLFNHKDLVPFRVLAASFKSAARDRVLRKICTLDSAADELKSLIAQFDGLQKLRNESFHGFGQPNEDDVLLCEDLAENITELIERQRLQLREQAKA